MNFDCRFTKGNNWFRYRAAAIIVEEGYVLLAGNANVDYFYSVGGAVHMNETAENAVIREVYEVTGIYYEVERLAVIHENFFKGDGKSIESLDCHEIAFYFLMKPKGSRILNSNSYTMGVKEDMHWVKISKLDQYKSFPTFLKDYLINLPNNLIHIVTHESEI